MCIAFALVLVGFRSERATIRQAGFASSRLAQKWIALLADNGCLRVAEHSCSAQK